MVLLVGDIDKSEEFDQEIPKEFICDIINGEVFLYKGWKEALENQKTVEEIMGCSGMQATILYLIEIFFLEEIGRTRYKLLGNEIGIKTDEGNLFSLDKAIYSKQDFPRKDVTKGYISVPPKIIFEVDVNVDTGKNSEMVYVSRKIQALLDFGVEKVIWIFGENEKVLVADSKKEWIITNWSADIEVLDGHILNLKKLDLEES